jgi:hypothetical protein
LFAYFGAILPAFDEDRVYASDIKKIIRWYEFLQERHLLVPLFEDSGEEE